jgi:hypothetical protein
MCASLQHVPAALRLISCAANAAIQDALQSTIKKLKEAEASAQSRIVQVEERLSNAMDVLVRARVAGVCQVNVDRSLAVLLLPWLRSC